jgi:ABC-type uncharacterized transport system permease subunit
MAGLVPAIHVFMPPELDKSSAYRVLLLLSHVLIWHAFSVALLQDVDGREKPGHDEF